MKQNNDKVRQDYNGMFCDARGPWIAGNYKWFITFTAIKLKSFLYYHGKWFVDLPLSRRGSGVCTTIVCSAIASF